jgi:uncharacterized protein (DUF2252 family)
MVAKRTGLKMRRPGRRLTKRQSTMIKLDDRQRILTEIRNLKMAQSAYAYVRGPAKFYEWLENSSGVKLPEGPPVWICGDCHVGNLGPLADTKARVLVQIRDLRALGHQNP